MNTNSSSPKRIALRPQEAAEALGVSRDYFEKRILGDLKTIRRGRLRLIPVSSLEAWLDENAATVLGR